jgi:hypothetical protein
MLRELVRKQRPRAHAPGTARPSLGTPAPAARLGRLESVAADGVPQVTAPGWLDAPERAVLGAPPPGRDLEASIGRGVVLLPLEGAAERAVIVGWVADAAPAPSRDLTVDGRRVVISAEHELELSCGEARVTLTQDGRVLIKGKGVLTDARQVNRIRGGQVQIN